MTASAGDLKLVLPGVQRRQIEVDVLVDQVVDDLARVGRFLDRLVVEELPPAVEALTLEVDRDGLVVLVGREL